MDITLDLGARFHDMWCSEGLLLTRTGIWGKSCRWSYLSHSLINRKYLTPLLHSTVIGYWDSYNHKDEHLTIDSYWHIHFHTFSWTTFCAGGPLRKPYIIQGEFAIWHRWTNELHPILWTHNPATRKSKMNNRNYLQDYIIARSNYLRKTRCFQ